MPLLETERWKYHGHRFFLYGFSLAPLQPSFDRVRIPGKTLWEFLAFKLWGWCLSCILWPQVVEKTNTLRNLPWRDATGRWSTQTERCMRSYRKSTIYALSNWSPMCLRQSYRIWCLPCCFSILCPIFSPCVHIPIDWNGKGYSVPFYVGKI